MEHIINKIFDIIFNFKRKHIPSLLVTIFFLTIIYPFLYKNFIALDILKDKIEIIDKISDLDKYKISKDEELKVEYEKVLNDLNNLDQIKLLS